MRTEFQNRIQTARLWPGPLSGVSGNPIQAGPSLSPIRADVFQKSVLKASANFNTAATVRFGGAYYSYVPTPDEIIAELDRHVIGQDQAKEVLGIAVHDHMKRVGMQISLETVHDILKDIGTLTESEEQADKFLKALTLHIRKATLVDETLPDALAKTFREAEDNGVFTLSKANLASYKVRHPHGPEEDGDGAEAQGNINGNGPLTSETARIVPIDELAAGRERLATFITSLHQAEVPEPRQNKFTLAANLLVDELKSDQDVKEENVFFNEQHKINIKKKNILVLGPSGVGKSEMGEVLSNFLGLPFLKKSANLITSPGYIGDKATSIAEGLLDLTDGDEELAGRGIVYMDEIDKLRKTTGARDGSRDVGGQGAQDSLLTIMENAKVDVEHKAYTGEKVKKSVDMTHVLFIFAGAFSNGLAEIIAKRVLPKSAPGFSAEREKVSANHLTPKQKDALLKYVIPDDLIEYGFSKEFVGRMPNIVTVQQLTAETIKRIITEPKNALEKQYQAMLKIDGVKISFEPKAFDVIADYALELGTGARSLQNILELLTQDIRRKGPNLTGPSRYEITAEDVRQKLKAHYKPDVQAELAAIQ